MRFKHKYAIPAWTCLTLYGSRDRNVKFSSKVYCTVAVGIGKGGISCGVHPQSSNNCCSVNCVLQVRGLERKGQL